MYGKFIVFRSERERYKFNFTYGLSGTILNSEYHLSLQQIMHTINQTKLLSAEEAYYEKKVTTDGRYYFILRSDDWDILATSEIYEKVSDMQSAANIVQHHASYSDIEDLT